MERHFEQDLEHVRQRMLHMGWVAEQMIANAIKALVERQDELAREVIAADREVDLLEVEIDELCKGILARQQPAAGDLRFLVAVMKIIADIERIGDSAVNIAQSVEVLNQEPPLKPYIDLPRMGALARRMVRESLDSFVNRSSQQALAVCALDDEVDGFYKQLFRELLTYMIEDPRNVSRALHLLLISRNLERVADHATNVAEDVIFYVEGRDIRHSRSRMIEVG
jgi:phosphate transport system protein